MCSYRTIFSCVLDVKGAYLYIYPPQQKHAFQNFWNETNQDRPQHQHRIRIILTCPSRGSSGPLTAPKTLWCDGAWTVIVWKVFTFSTLICTMACLFRYQLLYSIPTSSQKLGICASRRVRSVWKSLGHVRFGSKMFWLKILAFLHIFILISGNPSKTKNICINFLTELDDFKKIDFGFCSIS